jgi:Raf kinase inhibitor-like YbhB/YbcL family protein
MEILINIMSKSFGNNGNHIPKKYACQHYGGYDISPQLSWQLLTPLLSNQIKSYALICEDPDASNGSFVHWIIQHIPVDITNLPENISANKKSLDEYQIIQGINDFGNYGYGGPCPPTGSHRYLFTIFALDIERLNCNNCDKHKFYEKIKNHIVAKGTIIGIFP